MTTTRWRGDDTETREDRPSVIRHVIPSFSRRPFRGVSQQSVNPSLDMIVRTDNELPVGVVSKQYRLVQHTEVFDLAVEALKQAKIALDEVTCELALTPHGERMALGLQLPDKYGLDLGDRGRMDLMGLRLQCFNSVDGSTRFKALLGWFRFVCSNGLVVGATTSNLRSRHDEHLEVEDIGLLFREGLRLATDERQMYRAWAQTEVTRESIQEWVDGPLAEAWGKKAAARAYYIVETGCDARFVKPFERSRPSCRTVERSSGVPGSIVPARSAFAVCQVLAWLAKERRDVEEQLEWSRQIGDLMKRLLNRRRDARRHAQLSLPSG